MLGGWPKGLKTSVSRITIVQHYQVWQERNVRRRKVNINVLLIIRLRKMLYSYNDFLKFV